jgi:hypothetical protein
MRDTKKGAFLMSRGIYDSPIWYEKPAWWFKVWIYILGNVNHTEFQGFSRGEGFFTREKIFLECGLSKDGVKAKSIDNVIRWLRERQDLTTQKTTRGIRIKVLNYEKYQDFKTYKNDTENDLKTTQKRHRNDTIRNNDNNEKNENNIVAIWNSILPIKGKNETIKQGMPVMKECRKETEDIRGEIQKLKYSKQEIVASMLCYRNEICSRGEGSYAEHRFSLWEFLKQSNGCRKFMQDVSDEMVEKVDDFYFKNKNEQN